MFYRRNYFHPLRNTSVKGIAPITDKEYFVMGSTALLDAVGKTINKIEMYRNIQLKKRELNMLCL